MTDKLHIVISTGVYLMLV